MDCLKPARISDPAISFISPFFNETKFLREHADIMLRSDASFELLYCDDGSTDDSLSLLEHAAQDERVGVYRNTVRQGAGETRNALLAVARAAYVSPSDCDDIPFVDAVFLLQERLANDPAAGAICGSCIRVLLDDSDVVEFTPDFVGGEGGSVWDLYDNPYNHHGTVLRRDAVLRAGGYGVGDEVDDYSMFLRLVEQCPVRFAPEIITGIWRVSLNEITVHRDEAVQRRMQTTITRAAKRRLDMGYYSGS